VDVSEKIRVYTDCENCTESNDDSFVLVLAPPFLLGANFVTPELPLGSAFLIELMGTFLLVWTVCMTAVSKKSIASNIAPIAIGWSVLLAHLILIPYTGCGINPARSFGPHMVNIIAGEEVGAPGWWVYYTAPFVG
jgi:aquaporin-1